MSSRFKTNVDFQQISHDLDVSRGLLRDAWVRYQGELWYPKLITDRNSGKRGFEFNATGTWGAKDAPESRKEKLDLEELIVRLADPEIPAVSFVRCTRDLPQRDGNARKVKLMEFSERFSRLLALSRS